jgi:hypothetical protein
MVEDVCLAVGDKDKVFFLGRAGGGIPSEEEIFEYLRKVIAKKAKPFRL